MPLNPSIVLNADGYELGVANNSTLSSTNKGIVSLGSDGSSARILSVNSSGQLIVVGAASDNSANSTSKLPVLSARANTSAPTWSDGSMVPLSVDTSGALRVSGTISASNPSVSSAGSTSPASATYIGGTDGTNLRGIRVSSDGTVRIDPTGTTSQPVYQVTSDGYRMAVKDLQTINDGYEGLLIAGRNDDLLLSPNVVNHLKVNQYGAALIAPYAYGRTVFGEFRVAENITLGTYLHRYNVDPLLYETSTQNAGTVTHDANNASLQIACTSAATDFAKLRTIRYFRYRPGKGMLIRQSVFHSSTSTTNSVRRWGYYDDNDGLFWELNGTDLRIVRRTSSSGSPVDNVISRSSWIGDKLDGTGINGITLDLTKDNLYEIQFSWHGANVLSFFINKILVHQIYLFNVIAGPFMRQCVLPLSYEIINSGASTSSNFKLVAASVLIEGASTLPAQIFGAANTSDISVTTTERPLFAIRLKSTFNSIANRMIVFPEKLFVQTEGNRAGYRLILNPTTLTGASWTSVDNNSGVEYDQSATAYTGGVSLLRGFLPNTNDGTQVDLSHLFSEDNTSIVIPSISGVSNILLITGVNENNGTTLMKASLTWSEVR